jgi:predicted metal-dependent enzyme (double-stranded beta helix superfamily)
MARLPAVQVFIDEVRAIFAEQADMEARFERVRPRLQELLKDAKLNKRSEDWPFRNDPARRYVENLLFYEDPDHGFVLNSLMKKPGEVTSVHDHAHTWTLYGVLRGGERVTRYVRKDDGASDVKAELEKIDDRVVSPGYIDFVRPYEVHVEATGDEPTVGVIFRSHKVGGFPQNHYDVETGAIMKSKGPVQIPYDL